MAIKICKSCGKEYKSEFCEHCGYGKPVEKSCEYDKLKTNRQIKAEHEEGKKKLTSKLTVLITAIVVCIVMVLLLLYREGIIFSDKKEKAIEKYFTAISEKDYDKFLEALPKQMGDAYEANRKEQNVVKDEYIEKCYEDYFEKFGDFSLIFKYGRQDKWSKEEIEETEKLLNEAYDSSFDISDAYTVRTIVEFKGDKATETYKYDVNVAKIGRKWYVTFVEDIYDNTVVDMDE